MPSDPSKPSASMAEMQKTADDIGRLVREIRSVQSAMRAQMIMGSVAMLLVMFIFGLVLYKNMRENLAAEKLQAAASARFNTVFPVLLDRVKASVHVVLPEYQKLAQQRLAAATPVLQSRLRAQLDKLPAQMSKDLDADLEARIKQTTLFASKEVTAAFPALGPTGAHELSEKFEKSLTAEAEKLRAQLQESLDTEMSRFRAALEKFPSSDVAGTDSSELTRRFLHSLILLADYYVLSDEAPSISLPGVSPAPAAPSVPAAPAKAD